MFHVLNLIDDLILHLGSSLVIEAQLGPSLSDFLPTFHTFLGRLMVNFLIHMLFVNFLEMLFHLRLQ